MVFLKNEHLNPEQKEQQQQKETKEYSIIS